jgi:hypothetical protein
MADEKSQVSQGDPPLEAVATAGGSSSLAEAMAAVLKAFKPLDGLVKAQSQALARGNALWEAFKQLCQLPPTTERALIERFVGAAEQGYLAWLVAYEATEASKRALHQAEEELEAAHTALKEAVAEAGKQSEMAGDKTLAGARYMLSLLSQQSSRVSGKISEERKPTELSEEDEIPLAKFRGAVVDFFVSEAVIHNRHAVLEPLLAEVNKGAQLDSVKLPVRPLEEEVVRYLSHLENNLQSRQELHRRAYPLLKERLALVEAYAGQTKTLDAAVKEIEALNRPSLVPHIWALNKVRELVVEESSFSDFNGRSYNNNVAKQPDTLQIFDRAKSTPVEKDQIDYLRKQMRVVAFAVAHREEASYNLKRFHAGAVVVTPDGVGNAASWKDCLAWYEELRRERDEAELETLSRQTKAELLSRSIEHYNERIKDEMSALYKTLNAMIPRNGPLPSNELRKLINQAAWICTPLEASGASYPVY